ncbi:hypothetical protein NDA16_003655 [Ustilago loliicola]|nr:hypothetical protein NDA16_003655 [Ustilago loliicola]
MASSPAASSPHLPQTPTNDASAQQSSKSQANRERSNSSVPLAKRFKADHSDASAAGPSINGASNGTDAGTTQASAAASRSGAAAAAAAAAAPEQKDNFDSLVDVMGASGVDLQAEEEAIQHRERMEQSQNARDKGAQPDDDELFLQVYPLAYKVHTLAQQHGLSVDAAVLNYLSLAARTRLKNILENMIASSRHRSWSSHQHPPPMFPSTSQPMYHEQILSDPVKQLAALEKAERGEEARRRRERLARDEESSALAAGLGGDDMDMDDGTGTPKGDGRKRPKKIGPGVAARNMSEDVRKRLADSTAMRNLGGGSSKYSWLSGGSTFPGTFSPLGGKKNKADAADDSKAPGTVLSQVVIRHISFTEIDFQTYVGQAALFLQGERNYANLNPEGGSGPCVYPGAHLYVYSFFHWLTAGGKNISPAQNVFAGLLTANNLIVALLYRQARMPPIAVLPLILSKRIYSIFLLRMFNDPIAILLVYIALLAAINARWRLSALLFSLGLGIKMNVLLFLPGLAAAALAYTGLAGAISYVSVVAIVQVLISLPFTLHDANAYLSHAFDFSRAFLYVWTVNWRFVDEKTFLSQPFAKGLLALHLALLAIFGLFRWTAIGKQGPQWLLNSLSKQPSLLDRRAKRAILCTAFTSNVIGILCSRSLHYQFYSWYFHQVPLLLWFSKVPAVVSLVVPVALEWCWNVFPSTETSSLVLLVCHVLLVSGCITLPGLSSSEESVVSKQQEEDEDEVDTLLMTDDLSASRKQAVTADFDNTSVLGDDTIEHDDSLERLAEARATKAAKEAKLRAAFRRRIATRRRVLSLLGRFSLLRPLLVILALALIFVVPHPQSPVSKVTYVDENALQPAQARVYWDYFDVTYADMLSEKVSRLNEAGSAERAEFVYSELQSYGLDVHRQQFKYDMVLPGSKAALSGTNVYARSETPRIDGREAIILTASWRSKWLGENDPVAPTAENATKTGIDARGRINVRGVASILALARYLTTQAHLSKDLIFVISDGHLEGIHAWSSAYFGSITPGLQVEPVVNGGSQVWNAISIDYPSDSFSSLEVQYEGFDGQLPNMDVINTVVRIAENVAGGIAINFGAKSSKSLLKEPIQRLAQQWGVRLRTDVEYELGNYEEGWVGKVV